MQISAQHKDRKSTAASQHLVSEAIQRSASNKRTFKVGRNLLQKGDSDPNSKVATNTHKLVFKNAHKTTNKIIF